MTDIRRALLWGVFSISLVMLWDAWNKHNGRPSMFDAPVAQAIDHILARAQAHGVKAGIHNGRPDVARARIAKGFRFVTVGSDARMLAAGSQDILVAMRK